VTSLRGALVAFVEFIDLPSASMGMQLWQGQLLRPTDRCARFLHHFRFHIYRHFHFVPTRWGTLLLFLVAAAKLAAYDPPDPSQHNPKSLTSLP
jgi:hypothetical protein